MRKHQIAMGLIPDPKLANLSQRSSSDELSSGISNFSLEIEMLNRMHVTNNNRLSLHELPVIYDHLLPDTGVELYLEEDVGADGLRWRLD
jgi:hypothetical protein